MWIWLIVVPILVLIVVDKDWDDDQDKDRTPIGIETPLARAPPTPPYYYPQVRLLLAPVLVLECFDIRFNKFLDELS